MVNLYQQISQYIGEEYNIKIYLAQQELQELEITLFIGGIGEKTLIVNVEDRKPDFDFIYSRLVKIADNLLLKQKEKVSKSRRGNL